LELSIIIPTHNRADILSLCLKHINEQTLPHQNFEIIVIDDGGTDHTKDIICEWQKTLPNLIYFHQDNSGQGNARNHALKYAEGEIILFIGDDILLEKTALEEHLLAHKKHSEKNSAVLGLILWHPDMKVTKFMTWLTKGKKGGTQFAFDLLGNKETADYRFFYTSNISLKHDILKKHRFDPEFESYGWEDIELGYRLFKEENLKIYYQKSAVGYHDHEIDERSLKNRMISIGKSAKIFHKKHPKLKINPPFWKHAILWLISRKPTLLISRIANKDFYYYSLSKRYFLKGFGSSRK